MSLLSTDGMFSAPPTTAEHQPPMTDKSPSPFPQPPTRPASIATSLSETNVVIGLVLAILVVMIAGLTLTYILLVRRRAKADEERMGGESKKISTSRIGGARDEDVVSLPPPRYSIEDPESGMVPEYRRFEGVKEGTIANKPGSGGGPDMQIVDEHNGKDTDSVMSEDSSSSGPARSPRVLV
ncbi:hypothetical protein DRE_05221 [Drechslerella stenobrocha 248]|uniref:Uncharacterized protein n=1 Tax=Drechslerella stenobrocha 248 TaxID=1043628 RepID=W7I9D8_9PEZI|nr:hypothetical protein DRE_05221 [Drechslerella stenobrocha 248]